MSAPVEDRQHLVGFRRLQVEDDARDAGVAIALDELEVIGPIEYSVKKIAAPASMPEA